MTVLLGALAAVGFGVGDFIAGFGGRRDPSPDAPVGVAFVASAVGALLCGVYLVLVADDRLTGNDIWWAAAAAIFMAAARPLLYRGMAKGPIVVFAPVFALAALIVPSILGLAVGQSLGLLEAIGVLVAIPAVVLMSSEQALPTLAEFRSSPVVLDAAMVGSLIGLGGLFLSFVSDDAGAIPALGIGIAGLFVVPLVAHTVGLGVRLNRTTITFGSIVGLTSITSFVLAALTFQRGNAAIGSALIGLSPGITIALAWRLLGERLWRIQIGGAICGALVVVLFALA